MEEDMVVYRRTFTHDEVAVYGEDILLESARHRFYESLMERLLSNKADKISVIIEFTGDRRYDPSRFLSLEAKGRIMWPEERGDV
jgi:hypothetical protein